MKTGSWQNGPMEAGAVWGLEECLCLDDCHDLSDCQECGAGDCRDCTFDMCYEYCCEDRNCIGPEDDQKRHRRWTKSHSGRPTQLFSEESVSDSGASWFLKSSKDQAYLPSKVEGKTTDWGSRSKYDASFPMATTTNDSAGHVHNKNWQSLVYADTQLTEPYAGFAKAERPSGVFTGSHVEDPSLDVNWPRPHDQQLRDEPQQVEKENSLHATYMDQGENRDVSHDDTHTSSKLACLWNNCDFDTLHPSYLGEHVVSAHVSHNSSQQQQQLTPALDARCNGVSMFQCEWQSCDFQGADLRSLDDHVTYDHLASLLPTPSELPAAKPEPVLPSAHNDCPETRDSPSANACCWMTDGVRCNKTFDHVDLLTEHLANDHVEKNRSSYTCHWSGCERCQRPFQQRQKILRHLYMHTKSRPFKCHVCKAQFADGIIYNQHLRVHSGERPYECKYCGKRFAVSTALSVHIRTHTGERPLACKWPGCNKHFSESSNLAKHMKTHSSARPHVCTFPNCTKAFRRNDQLVRHQNVHTKHLRSASATSATPPHTHPANSSDTTTSTSPANISSLSILPIPVTI